ncbi:MAG: hypothetical protein ACI4PF_05480 [Christensenellales bacterium]
MELVQVANFLNGRFLISNMKEDKKALLKGKLLSSYSLDFLGKSKNEKVYYDTSDFFFADKGINIYTVFDGRTTELVIRYDSSQVKRIEFLKNIPNFFKVKISKTDNIHKYTDKINEAIYKVFPTGLNANIEELLKASTPQVRIIKKRESYRVVNNTGLKTTLSFDECQYFKVNSKAKYSQPTLDIVADTFRNKQDFDNFLHLIVRDYPQLIKLDSNELTVARSNL